GAAGTGEGDQVVEVGDTDGSGPLQQAVEDVCRRLGVLERPVDGVYGAPEVGSECPEPQVADLRAQEPPGQANRVHGLVRRHLVSETAGFGRDEREIEPDVVPDEHGVTDELEEGGEHRLDLWRPVDHGLDRKSTRLNSSHVKISYAVFCLTKKTNQLLH